MRVSPSAISQAVSHGARTGVAHPFHQQSTVLLSQMISYQSKVDFMVELPVKSKVFSVFKQSSTMP
jgi:hypothetical protein